MTIRDNLSDQLEAMRRTLGLSVRAFAKKLGISRASLQGILNKTSNPRLDTISYIAQQAGMDAIELLMPLESVNKNELAQKVAYYLSAAAQLAPDQYQELQVHLALIFQLLNANAATAGASQSTPRPKAPV